MAELQVAAPPQTLPAMVRAKYPGVYDDLSDTELDTKVRAKFPGVYDDLPKPRATTPPARSLTGAKQATGIGPDPSLLDRAVAAVGPAIRGAGDVTGANWLLEHLGVPEGRLTGPETTARDAATRHTAAVGGAATGLLQMGDAVVRSATTQGLSAGGRAIAAMRAAAQQVTPTVKFEVYRRSLQAAGVPGPIAFGLANMMAGGGSKQETAPTAAGYDQYMPNASASPKAPAVQMPSEFTTAEGPFAPRAAGNTIAPNVSLREQELLDQLGGRPPAAAPTATPAALVASRPESGAAVAASNATRPAALSPARVANEVAIQARRQGLTLTPQEDAAAQALIHEHGVSAADVIATVKASRGMPSGFSLEEAAVYQQLKAAGKSGAEAEAAILSMRQLSKRLPEAQPGPAQHARGVTGKWKAD